MELNRFNQLLESKMGDVKPILTEQGITNPVEKKDLSSLETLSKEEAKLENNLYTAWGMGRGVRYDIAKKMALGVAKTKVQNKIEEGKTFETNVVDESTFEENNNYIVFLKITGKPQ